MPARCLLHPLDEAVFVDRCLRECSEKDRPVVVIADHQARVHRNKFGFLQERSQKRVIVRCAVMRQVSGNDNHVRIGAVVQYVFGAGPEVVRGDRSHDGIILNMGVRDVNDLQGEGSASGVIDD